MFSTKQGINLLTKKKFWHQNVNKNKLMLFGKDQIISVSLQAIFAILQQ